MLPDINYLKKTKQAGFRWHNKHACHARWNLGMKWRMETRSIVM